MGDECGAEDTCFVLSGLGLGGGRNGGEGKGYLRQQRMMEVRHRVLGSLVVVKQLVSGE